jgi:hypothetical protein
MTSTAVLNACGLAATAGHWQMRTRPAGVTLEDMTAHELAIARCFDVG